MSRQSKGDRSVRLLRVGENVRHALSDILNRDVVQDPDLSGVSITVTECQVSPDLRNATIFVLPLSGKNQKKVIAALNRASGFFRGHLGRSVRLKYTPKLRFEADNSFDEAVRMRALFEDPKVKQDLGGKTKDEEVGS